MPTEFDGVTEKMQLRSAIREAGLYGGGLVLGGANTVRHARRGYVDPRPFAAADIERTISHAVEIVDRLAQRGGITWTGKRVLEIGPGSDLSTGAVMLARGAAGYHAVDLFDNRWQAAGSLYASLGEALGVEFREEDLAFTQTSFPELPDLDGTYDLVVSNACLEHVAEVEALFRRLHELTASGGTMVHHIDGKAHMRWFRDHDPLNILRYPEWLYRRVLDFPGAPNRLRASDYLDLADHSGWRARYVPGREADASYLARTRVTRRFRGYPDLGVLTFTLVATAA